jgi:hypothetical protein
MKDRKVRNQSRTAKKSRPRRRRSSKPIALHTAEQYFAKPPRAQEIWNRVTHVITKMRSNRISLQHAAREFGIDPRTVVRRGGSALQKSATGRFAAKSSDRLLRMLMVPTSTGPREVAIRGSRRASQIGEYHSAVQKYLQTGDSSGLKKFRGKKIKDTHGVEIPLLTDLNELRRLGAAGVLSFESIYARVA